MRIDKVFDRKDFDGVGVPRADYSMLFADYGLLCADYGMRRVTRSRFS